MWIFDLNSTWVTERWTDWKKIFVPQWEVLVPFPATLYRVIFLCVTNGNIFNIKSQNMLQFLSFYFRFHFFRIVGS